MASKKTPLIQQLRDKSGTVYVFPSASEDIGLNLDTDVNGVALTHYALLNIPLIDRKTWLFGNQKGDEIGNLVVSKSLLNYMMNFETAILNQDTYNYQDYNTVTERVFWHWFNKINPATSLSYVEYGGTKYYYNTDVENRIVKCFGTIDAGNSLSGEFGVFNETYINIPSSYGSAPVFFVLNFDNNYHDNTLVDCASENLLGRSDNLSYISYTENDDKPYYDSAQSYFISNSSDTEAFEIVKDPTIIQELIKKVTGNDNITAYTIDEVNIDPNNQYSDLIDTEFQFNAILLYYSIYDQTSTVKTALATNLFGIIFLDGATEIESSDGVSYIQPIIKRKTTTENFGTGYSFRVNTRTMSIYDNSDAVIQDNTTLNSIITNDLSEAVSQLNRATDLLMLNTQTINTIRDQYDSVLDYYYTQRSDIKDLSTLINNYIQGKTVSKIDVAEARITDFYVNTDDNRFKFYVKTGQNDEYNEPIYDDIVTINENGITTADINAEDVYLQHGWYLSAKHVDLNNDESDPAVLTNVDKIDNTENIKTTITNAQTLLKDMFDSSSNLVINLYNNNADLDYNRFYISSDSAVFNSNNKTAVSYLKQTSTDGTQSKIDYVGLVPYIIAELQTINGYTYDPTNVIESVDDITSLRDALDYIIGSLNTNTKDYNVMLTISVYRNYDPDSDDNEPEKVYSYEKDSDIPDITYYNGENVTIQYKFDISENNNSITQILINSLNIKSAFDDEDKINSINISGVEITELSTYTSDKVNHYTGEYTITPDVNNTTNTITLKGNSAGLPASKDYMSTIKCYTKLYYWANFKDQQNTENISLEDIFVYTQYHASGEDGNLAQYLDNNDNQHKLSDLPSIDIQGKTVEKTELTIGGINSANEAYIYIMVPANILETNIKIGVGNQLYNGGFDLLYEDEEFSITEFDNPITYKLYRTSNMMSGQVNIQID